MLLPKAPSWFTRKLRELNPTLGVAHSGTPNGWRITQKIPYRHDYGWWEGHHITATKYRNEHVMFIPEIGSRVFSELQECHTNRFKTFVDYCKHFNIESA